MNIVVNGEDISIENTSTVADLLKKLDQDSKKVVVELNETIVSKSDYSEIKISDGDSFEIIQFVPGG